MSDRFEFGDRLRHPGRPEWGVGTVTRVEETESDGQRAQRVSIRFPGAGLKTILTSHATLEHAEAEATADAGENEDVREWAAVGDAEWLAPVAEKKLEEAMIGLPAAVRDPFVTPRERLARTLRLYKFEPSGHSLIEWATAQSGLADPLSRFSRQELEAFFARWAPERDAHLSRVLQDDPEARDHVSELLRDAGPAARAAVKRASRG